MPVDSPLFVSGSPTAARRLLLVSYWFPPARTVGALRWQRMAHFAAERGWELDVLSLHPDSAGQLDHAPLRDLPNGTRIYGVPGRAHPLDGLERQALNVYRRFSGRSPGAAPAASNGEGEPSASPTAGSLRVEDVRSWPRSIRELLRAYWSWIDYRRYLAWSGDVARLAQRIVIPGTHRAVITSAPPHPTHEAGRLISERTRLPFVMDMRDPWTLVQRVPEWLASPVFLRLGRHYESLAMAQASLVIANTEPFRAQLAARYPFAAERMTVVTNGCDDDPLPPTRRDRQFVIAYAGTIYVEQDPRSLLRAAAAVTRELALSPADFAIRMVGDFSSGPINLAQIAEDEGMSAYLEVGAPRPRAEALEVLAGATMLVTFPGYNDFVTIPAKTFECMRFSAWLLALSEPESATDVLLRGTTADVVSTGNVDGIASVIRKRIIQHREGIQPMPIAQETRFSRRYQAELLLDAMERIGIEPERAEQPPRPRKVAPGR